MNWSRILWGRWSWTRPFKSLAFVYLSLTAVGLVAGNRFIFHPPEPRYDAESSHIVMLDGEAEVACFFLPPPGPDAPLLLWSHGNAEDLGSLRPLFVNLHAAGFGILGYDYPGYGASEGRPGEKSCYEAVARTWRFATADRGIAAGRILIVGQSVGSGPATWLAGREDAGGLVLISPFLSAYRTVTRFPLFPGDRFNNAARMASVREPLLVVHGTEDGVIPFAQGKRLHELHPGPKRFLPVEGAGHNTIWNLARREIVDGIRDLARGTP